METKKNDDRILKLKKIVDEKKEEIKSVKRFNPRTTCTLDLDNQHYNLNVLTSNELKLLLVKLNTYALSANDLNVKLEICGFDIVDWMMDIRAKLEIYEQKEKISELKKLEEKLEEMLSNEKRKELELDKIEAFLD